MAEPLPILIAISVEIAWDYLERTGELGDAAVASRFLVDDVEPMVRRGERRRLLLSNRAKVNMALQRIYDGQRFARHPPAQSPCA